MTTNSKTAGQRRHDNATDAIDAYRYQVLRDPVVMDWRDRVEAELGPAIQVNLICLRRSPGPNADTHQTVVIRYKTARRSMMRLLDLPKRSDFYCQACPYWQRTEVRDWDCLTGDGEDIRRVIQRGYQVITAHAAGEADVVFGLVVSKPKD